MTVQYRIAITKKEELIDGPDDADIVVTVPHSVASEDGFDATVEFMRGRLKAAGHTGDILELLRSGGATSAIRSMALAAS